MYGVRTTRVTVMDFKSIYLEVAQYSMSTSVLITSLTAGSTEGRGECVRSGFVKTVE